MASVTHAGATWNTTAGNKTVVATPAVGDLIVIVSPYTANITAGVSDNNADGLGTYTQVDTDRTGFDTAGHLKVWVRDALIGSATSTTFTASQPSSTGGGLSVFRVSGVTRTGASAIRSNGGQSAGTNGTTPAPVLSATPLTDNPIIAAVCNGTNSTTTVTPRSGYTEAFDGGYNTPAAGFETSFLNSGETSATITFGSTTASAFASVAVEIDTSALPPGTPSVSGSASNSSNSTSYTVAVPGGTVDGNLLIGAVASDFGTSAGNSFPTPAWTALSTSTYDGGTDAFHLKLYARVAASEPANYSISHDSSDSAAIITRVIDWDSSAGIAGAIGQVAPTTTGNGTTAPSIDTFGSNDLTLTFHAGEGASGGSFTWTSPSGMTKVLERQSTTWASLLVSYMQASSSPTGTKVATPTITLGTGAGCTITIKGTSSGATGSAVAPAAVASGAGTVTVTANGDAVAPAAQVVGTGSLDGVVVTGSGEAFAPAAAVSGAGTALIAAAGGATVAAAVASSTGSVLIVGAGSAVAPAAVVSGQETTHSYITGVSSNGRYFVDQYGAPMLIRGDSPWSLPVKLSASQVDTYIANRLTYGVNTLLMSIIGNTVNGGPNDNGATFDGILPFTSGDPTQFNAAYWSRMDTFIAKMRDAGITVMIYPIDGWTTLNGGVFDTDNVTNTQAQTYGNTLATRYLSYPNVVWAFGGDYAETTVINDRMNACLTGIRNAGDTRLVSIQLMYETSESDNSTFWEPKVDYDWVYTYRVTYKGLKDAYDHSWTTGANPKPALFCEGAYEGSTDPNHPGTDLVIRRQAGWALTSGSPGDFTGQEGVWNFFSDWQTRLDTTAATQLKSIRDAIEGVDWWTLVPDDSNQLVTAGRGTRITTDSATYPTGNTFVTAARAADGTLAVIYLPNASSAITVDMSKIGANPTATWVDPTNGTTVSATPASSYSRGNNAAGSTDWLLILTGDAASSTGSGTVTAPTSQAVGSGTVTVTGSGSPTAPVATTSGAGSVRVTGTGEGTAPASAAAGVGGVLVAGSGALTASAAVVSGSGTVGSVPITGSGDLVAPVAQASGVGTAPATGTGSVTAQAAQVAGSATVRVSASGSPSAPSGTASGAGSVVVAGSGSAAAPDATVAGSGNIGAAPITGTGEAVAVAAVANGAGTLGPVPINGTGSLTAPASTATGSGAVLIDGNGALVTPTAIINGTGAVVITATGEAVAPAAIVVGSMNAKLTYRLNEGTTARLNEGRTPRL